VSDFLDPTAKGPEEGDETQPDAGAQTSGAFDFVELAPEGWYEVVCTSAIFGSSKNSGAAQWTLTLAAPALPAAAAKYYLTNAPGAFWRIEKDLRTLGLEAPAKGVSRTYTSGDFVGKKFEALGKHDTWQGRRNFKFNEIRPGSEGPGARAYAAA